MHGHNSLSLSLCGLGKPQLAPNLGGELIISKLAMKRAREFNVLFPSFFSASAVPNAVFPGRCYPSQYVHPVANLQVLNINLPDPLSEASSADIITGILLTLAALVAFK